MKNLVPSPILRILYRVKRRARVYSAFLRDAFRYLRGSSTLEMDLSRAHIEARMTTQFHAIEKGFSMPDMRDTFGLAHCESLLDWMRRYREAGYPETGTVYVEALQTLRSYLQHHRKQITYLGRFGQELAEMTRVHEAEPSRPTTLFLKERDAPYRFEEFEALMISRHSIRNFTGESVECSLLEQAAGIAAHSPSACNRQAWRLTFVMQPDRMQQLCTLQQGNRGFGHLAGAMVIVKGDLRAFHDAHERNQVYVDGGIYGMSFLLALHALGLGACPLNWSAKPEQDRGIRAQFSIPDHEVVIMCIAVGQLPERQEVAKSTRFPVSDFATEDGN